MNIPNKIIRTICLFTEGPEKAHRERLTSLADTFTRNGFTVQTLRLCAPDPDAVLRFDAENDGSLFLSMGRLPFEKARALMPNFLAAQNVAFNVDLAGEPLELEHTTLLTEIIRQNSAKTFSFTYTFNNVPSSPFFPSATYARSGVAIGLQPTNLAEGCRTIEAWLERMRAVWFEIEGLMAGEPDFLGIDTSIAPLYEDDGSLLHIVRRTTAPLDQAATSDVFLRIARFIKGEGLKRTGLCGLMFPCLEDFEVARAYERGEFSIERNVFLSLHSGLGIDAYPIGTDEDANRVLDILRLVQGLSNKYSKPLSIRLISDGNARIGEKASFNNPYLKDVTIRKL